ncbi:hypothetical protein [uncultured Microbacterium sp.]|uniref:hypothetical protein n=1 Tax=uncultured Microbacterium sp. TaxID=191216 RepID=UPI00262E1790|nr:hypothetical protein [uncultured Microbacterium sp.]
MDAVFVAPWAVPSDEGGLSDGAFGVVSCDVSPVTFGAGVGDLGTLGRVEKIHDAGAVVVEAVVEGVDLRLQERVVGVADGEGDLPGDEHLLGDP